MFRLNSVETCGRAVRLCFIYSPSGAVRPGLGVQISVEVLLTLLGPTRDGSIAAFHVNWKNPVGRNRQGFSRTCKINLDVRRSCWGVVFLSPSQTENRGVSGNFYFDRTRLNSVTVWRSSAFKSLWSLSLIFLSLIFPVDNIFMCDHVYTKNCHSSVLLCQWKKNLWRQQRH